MYKRQVYILAPSTILVAIAVDRYLSKARRIPFAVPVLATISILIIGFGFSTIHGQKYQRDVLKNIHSLFPNPVTYLDYCGMVPSFDRILEPGLFINPDSLDNRRYFSETPFMEKLLQKHQPKFYISNIAALDVDNVFAHSIALKFSQTDENALRDNFVHFWGPIYVAGKHLPRSDANTEIAFNIIVEGDIYLSWGVNDHCRWSKVNCQFHHLFGCWSTYLFKRYIGRRANNLGRQFAKTRTG